MASGDLTHVQITPVILTTTPQIVYTVPAGKTAIFLSLWVCNLDSAARQLSVGVWPSSFSPGAYSSAGIISAGIRVNQSASTALVAGEPEKYVFEDLEAGTYIKAWIDSGLKVSLSGGVTLKEL